MVWTNPTDKPICVDAEKAKIVDCDATDAAFLLVGPGGQLPDEVAAQYATDLEREVGRRRKDAGPPSEDKEADAPPEDKSAAGPTVPRRR